MVSVLPSESIVQWLQRPPREQLDPRKELKSFLRYKRFKEQERTHVGATATQASRALTVYSVAFKILLEQI